LIGDMFIRDRLGAFLQRCPFRVKSGLGGSKPDVRYAPVNSTDQRNTF
jgi:hypothetical protein